MIPPMFRNPDGDSRSRAGTGAGTGGGWFPAAPAVAASALVVVLCALAACSGPAATVDRAGQAVAARVVSDPDGADPTRLASPVVRGGDNGLELRWWVCVDDETTLRAAISPYADNPVPMDEHTLRLWRENGLRVVAVPLEDLSLLRAQLRLAGTVQRQWLGQVPRWAEAVRGPAIEGGLTIGLERGRLRLGPGALRMLVRCWAVPVVDESDPDAPTARSALHIELVPQHEEPRRRADDPILGFSDRPSRLAAEDKGLLFSRLTARMVAREGYAYLVVPLRPGEPGDDGHGQELGPGYGLDGDAPREIAGDGGDSPPPALGRVARAGQPRDHNPFERVIDDDGAVVGPPSQPVITLGEAMLIAEGAPERGRSYRAVVLFIPRVPEHYRLLP